MNTRIAIGSDHAGFDMKSELLPWLDSQGYDVLDLGAYDLDPNDDYPDFAEAVGEAVASGRTPRGILICGSGVGACIAANKVPGVRASMCHDSYSSRQGVEHDDMNILCLGSRVIGPELAKELVTAFMTARFTGEERHQRRLEKTLAIERAAHGTGSPAHSSGE